MSGTSVARLLRRWGPYVALLALLALVYALTGGWARLLVVVPAVAVLVHAARRRWRDVGVAVVVAVLVLVAAIVVVLTIDLGPAVRARAEQAGTAFLKRPLHIGRIGIHLWSGRFVLERVVIEGLTPADAPFFDAARIRIAFPWWRFVGSGQIVVEQIELDDWRMQVENFGTGRHNAPNFSTGRTGGQPVSFRVARVHASRGEFTFIDHGSWQTVARHLDITVVNATGQYVGTASSSGGMTQIQDSLPMASALRAWFTIDDGKVKLSKLELENDGARTTGTGEVNFRKWPEQFYDVESVVDFARARAIFFHRERWRARGEGRFKGRFTLGHAWRHLAGTFESDLVHVNEYAFPDLRGSLVWTRDLFEVNDASSRFYGGRAAFDYRIAPLGTPAPKQALFDVTYRDVDLAAFTDFLGGRGLRLAGTLSGRNRMEWTLGRFSEVRGEGQATSTPPPGIAVLPRVPAAAEALWPPQPPEPRAEIDPRRHTRRFAVGGHVAYRFGPEWIEIDPSWVATPATYVGFSGQTAWGERSTIPFYARSLDWQESDDFLVSVITAFGSPAGSVRVGGRGEFRGVMLESFRQSRIEGHFNGEGLRAWDVDWGQARGHVVIEDSYVRVTGGVVVKGDSEARVDGRFSLGTPRRDGGEEFRATVRLVRRDLADLRHAFELDDYPIDGKTSGEFQLYGPYRGPFGTGTIRVDEASAYGEPFEGASASLRFEGSGVRLDAVRIDKGGGTITGAAWVGWDRRYSFYADGSGIPVERVVFLQYPQAPLSGEASFTVTGASTFDHPRYELKGRIADLALKDEEIGAVTLRLGITDDLMSVGIEAASPRLSVTGSGQMALTRAADADLLFRYTETAIDPYLRALSPSLSPFTRVVATGTLRLVGQLNNPSQLLVRAEVDRLDVGLYDYTIGNDGPLALEIDQQTVRFERVKLLGENTELDLSGTVDLPNDRVAVTARGLANLAVLQGFYRDVRSSGRVELIAEVRGALSNPRVDGFAVVSGGRVRHPALPHAFERINGRVSFGSRGIWFDDVRAEFGLGDRPVQFGGRIALEGLAPRQLNLSAEGQGLVLRLADGLRATVDADLSLVGTAAAPTLRGAVTVTRAVWEKEIDLSAGLFGLAAARAVQGAAAPAVPVSAVPIQFDVRVRAPSSLAVKSNVAEIDATADLTLRGTLDRPLLFGRVEAERGQLFFEGKRYVMLPGGTIDFSSPIRIEPEFNLAAETRVRAPGQIYNVTVALIGTVDNFDLQLSSDPPLSQVDVLSLLFNDAAGVDDTEIRALVDPQSARRDLALSAAGRAGQILTAPLSSGVERALGLDTVQIRPTIGLDSLQGINATARLTIGKRLSDRAYITWSKSLDASNRDFIILVEYDQNARLSWILSRNEDETYALEVRVRHVF